MGTPRHHESTWHPSGRTDWTDDALCAQTDPEAFFVEKGGTTQPAKAVCARCPVTAACLQHALDTDQAFGVWGGLSAIERRALKDGRMVTRTCPVCGDTFTTPDRGSQTTRCCSQRCAGIGRVRNRGEAGA